MYVRRSISTVSQVSHSPTLFPVPSLSHQLQLLIFCTPGDEASGTLAKTLSVCPWLTRNPTLSDVKEFVEPRLAECASSHPECFATRNNTGYLPTRLIAVSDSQGSALDPFLVETDHAGPIKSYNNIRYIALSHCWGRAQIITTRKENYRRHLASIPLQKISKTFHDTILVARTLGVHFIWIDSLRIIQDNHDDWAREASQMAGVYKNAWLTIAATGAVDGTRGLLIDRPGVEKAQAPRGEISVVFRRAIDHSAFENRNSWQDEDTTLLPLLERGWVLQEQLLSTRILHFTQQELL